MTEPPGANGDEEVVSEADKPFILVIFGTVVMFGVGAYSSLTGQWANAKDFITAVGPLVGMGWGYYFKTKAST